MLYELILINEIEQRAKIIFLSVDYNTSAQSQFQYSKTYRNKNRNQVVLIVILNE